MKHLACIAALFLPGGRDGGPGIRVMGCNVFDPHGTFIEPNRILD